MDTGGSRQYHKIRYVGDLKPPVEETKYPLTGKPHLRESKQVMEWRGLCGNFTAERRLVSKDTIRPDQSLRICPDQTIP
jgi:hypothetical protein